MSQWADQRGQLITSSGSEQRWHTREPQRAVLDAFAQPRIREINLLKSARFGWSSILMQVMGFFMDQEPAPILMVQPRIKDAEEWSKDQVQPTIDSNKYLRKLVTKQRQGESGNTIDLKTYPGGPLRLRGSNSPDGFRRFGVRVALCDEVDAYPVTVGAEGDIIELIYGRVQDAWNHVVANGSTPTEADISMIGRLFEASSKGYPFLVCPHCGEPHIRQFEKPDPPIVLRGKEQPVSPLVWTTGDPSSAHYVCPINGCQITQKHHRDMLATCYWVGEHWEYKNQRYTFFDGFDGRIGFSTWAGYVVSPYTTPEELVKRYERSKSAKETQKVFTNTVLGLPWVEKGEELRSDILIARKERFTAEVPKKAVYLTAGVDVQANRWEMEVIAWGPKEESWSVYYEIIPGDPSQDDEWWTVLRPYLLETFTHESGALLPISAVGIDHGFLSKRVESFVKRFDKPQVWAMRGQPGEQRPFVETAHKRKKRLRMQKAIKFRPEAIGDHEGKLTVMQRLRVAQPGPGYCHFPHDRDDDWFEQLTAEKLVTRYTHLRPRREWVLLQERNEALDCRKYGFAAFLLAAPNLSKPMTTASVPKKPTVDMFKVT